MRKRKKGPYKAETNQTVSVTLTPDILRALDKNQRPDETRSAQVRRLLESALSNKACD